MVRIEINREATTERNLRECYAERSRINAKEPFGFGKVISHLFCPLLISLGFLNNSEKDEKYGLKLLLRDIISGIFWQ